MDDSEVKKERTIEPQKSGVPASSRKRLMMLGAVFGMLSLIVVLTFFAFKKTPNLPGSSNTKASNQAIAKMNQDVTLIADYIETQKNPDGSYKYQGHEKEDCPVKNGKLNCSFLPDNISYTVNTWSAFGSWTAYKTSGESKYLEASRRDLNELIEWCEKTKEDCTYLLAQPIVINRDLQDEKITAFLTSQAKILQSNKSSEDLMLKSIEARELALLSEALKDPSLMQTAQARLDSVTEQIQKDSRVIQTGTIELPRHICWASLAHVEVGRISKDSQRVVNAIEYLLQGSRFSDIKNFETALQKQPCIEAFFLASKYGGSLEYREAGQQMLNQFLQDHFDNSQNPIKYGDGGTTSFSRQKIAKDGKIFVFLADAAYTAYLQYLSFAVK